MLYWDKVAETRWGRYVIEVERDVILRAHSLVGHHDRAVDVGCGSGRWSKILSGLGWTMTCIDVDPPSLEVCKLNVPAAECTLANPNDTAIPCETNSASMALCIEVAPVLESAWFVPELKRVLKDSGVFVGVHVNRRSWRGLAVRLKYLLSPCPSSSIYYLGSYAAWKKNLLQSGFEMVHEEGFCWSPFQRSSNFVLVPIFTRLERLLHLHRLVSISPWIVFVARKKQLGKALQAVAIAAAVATQDFQAMM